MNDILTEVRRNNGSLSGTYTPPTVNLSVPDYILKDTLSLAEHHLYGSARLGVKSYPDTLIFSSYDKDATPGVLPLGISKKTPWYSWTHDNWVDSGKLYAYVGNTSYMFRGKDYRLSRFLGLKHYELTDHLGNVNVAVSDKISGTGIGNAGEYAYFSANISSYNDYYPFGMPMPNRSASSSDYRFSLNGIEQADEVAGEGNHYTALFGEYSPRIARRWNQDPKSSIGVSVYAIFGNNPILYSDILLDTPTRAAVAKAEAVRSASAELILDFNDINDYHKAAAHIRKEYEFDKFGNFGNVNYVIKKNDEVSAFAYTPNLRTKSFFSGNLDYSLHKISELGVRKTFVMTAISLGHEHVHNFQQFVMQLNTDEQRTEREVLAVEFSLFPNNGYMRNMINEYVKKKGQSWDVEFDDRLSNGVVDLLKRYAESNYNRLPTQELKNKYKHIIEKIKNRPYNEDAVK